MIENHRPPEADVPRDPGNARRPDVVPFAVGPVRLPFAFVGLTYMQADRSRPPQALFYRESVEVELRQLPRGVQLPHEHIAIAAHERKSYRRPIPTIAAIIVAQDNTINRLCASNRPSILASNCARRCSTFASIFAS